MSRLISILKRAAAGLLVFLGGYLILLAGFHPPLQRPMWLRLGVCILGFMLGGTGLELWRRKSADADVP